MKYLLGLFISTAVTAAGCAGGPWLESQAEDILPAPAPSRGYPTAIRPAAARASSADTPPTASEDSQQPAPVPQPFQLNPNPPPAAPEQHSRLEQPKLPAPTLAVLPPQYQR